MSSYCSTSSPAFAVICVICVPAFGHSNRCIVLSHCCFHLHFPGDIWYGGLFSYVYEKRRSVYLAKKICVSSLVRCLLRSLVYILVELSVFLLLSFKGSLYILDNSPLSDISFANIFSQSETCLLILLALSWTKQKFLILMKCSLLIISSMDGSFGVVSKKSSPEGGDMGIYVYVELIHFVIKQKLTHHCKTIILQ